MDIAEFIAARLDEDEAGASALIADGLTGEWVIGRYGEVRDSGSPARAFDGIIHDRASFRTVDTARAVRAQAQARHVACHDPARVLREVAAKRAILARHSGDHMCPEPADPDWVVYEAGERVVKVWPCGDLRSLAAIWNDHPDWQEWA